jgi:muramoyltetrapeptide carboxypeptidase
MPTPSVRRRALGLIAPAGYVPDPATADRTARYFSARGWRVVSGDSVFARHQRFAGTDELRLADLHAFAADRSVDVVMSARGGYGLSRLLDAIDYAAIAKAAPILVGYSDFTAFNLAYLARAGGVSFQGPSASDFAADVPDPYTIDNFFAVLDHDAHAIEFDAGGPDCSVRGRLWGGNLALVCALVGTPFLPRVRGGILFLEDVNEPAYRIERMFYQLRHAGILQRQRALVLGRFDPMPAFPNDNGFDLAVIVDRLRVELGLPVVTGLPFGHVPSKATLPVGARAALTVRGGRATLSFNGYPRLR